MERGGETKMEVRVSSQRSRGESSSSSSSKPIFKRLRSRVVYLSIPKSRYGSVISMNKWRPLKKNDPPTEGTMAAFNFLNRNSEYKLLKEGSVTPVLLYDCILFHVNFIAKNTDVDDALEEMFFAELTVPAGRLEYSVGLCKSLGPSISGDDRLNGCCYCRQYNNVWHPKDGGFTCGGDRPSGRLKR